jgi:heme exporter protein A
MLFRALSFSLGAGEALRIAGVNGSGKTSLLRLLCGLAAPAAGEVRWKGEPVRALREEYSAQLLYLGHAPAVKDELTVLENLEFSARISDLGSSDCKEALRRLAIAHLADLPARFLSQGQRKRAALARLALSARVPLWLLDEPFSALDDEAIGRVSALCEAHLAAGGMVVLTSHQDVPIGAAAMRALDLAG